MYFGIILVCSSSLLLSSISFKGIVEKLVLPTSDEEYTQLKKINYNFKRKNLLNNLNKNNSIIQKLAYIRKFNKENPEVSLYINDESFNPQCSNITKGGLLDDWEFDIFY